MLRIGVSQTLNPNQNDKILLKGIPAGTMVRSLYLVLTGTLTRGGAAVASEPEIASQLAQNISFKKGGNAPSSWRVDINGINGRTLDFLTRYINNTRNNSNKRIQAADTTIRHVWEIPLVPNLPYNKRKVSRPKGEWINGSSLDVRLVISDFDNTNDITNLVGSFEVFAQYEAAPVGYNPNAGGIVIDEKIDLANGDEEHFETYSPFMFVFLNRSAYQSVSLRSGNREFYNTLTPLDVDLYQTQARRYDHTETRNTQGDPLSNVPLVVAGLQQTESQLVVFDYRNQKDLSGTLTVKAHSKTAAIPTAILGWQRG